MDNFELTSERLGAVGLIKIKGYFGEEAGMRMSFETDKFLQAGILELILDFSQCQFLNSLGLSKLLDVSLRVVDDHEGRVIVSGPNEAIVEVINIAGIYEFVEYSRDVPGAMSLLGRQ